MNWETLESYYDRLLPTWKHELAFLYGFMGVVGPALIVFDASTMGTVAFATAAATIWHLLVSMWQSKRRQGEIQ